MRVHGFRSETSRLKSVVFLGVHLDRVRRALPLSLDEAREVVDNLDQAEGLRSGAAKLGEDKGETLGVARLWHLAVPVGTVGRQTTPRIIAGGNWVNACGVEVRTINWLHARS